MTKAARPGAEPHVDGKIQRVGCGAQRECGEETPEDERADRERQAYSAYLAYRQELEAQLQVEVDEAVRAVAQDQGIPWSWTAT